MSSSKTYIAGQPGAKSWKVATIAMKFRSNGRVFIVAEFHRDGRFSKAYLSCKSLPKSCKEGMLIVIGNRKMSYVDPITLNPVTVATMRYRGAAAFLNAVVKDEKIPT